MIKDTFVTHLDIGSCQQRVSALLQRKLTRKEFVLGNSDPVRGWVKGGLFYLYKKPNFGNIIFPVYQVNLNPINDGVSVVGEVKFSWACLLLTGFFLLLSAYFALPLCMGVFNDPSFNIIGVLNGQKTEIVLALTNLGIAIILILWGVFIYYYDGYYLKHYLRLMLLREV